MRQKLANGRNDLGKAASTVTTPPRPTVVAFQGYSFFIRCQLVISPCKRNRRLLNLRWGILGPSPNPPTPSRRIKFRQRLCPIVARVLPLWIAKLLLPSNSDTSTSHPLGTR
ncbi:hypothetical protein GGTG_07781 [Gaeumannomyces tritici R3-111a-1]|uniref:Uncharacterized protein n=1 Tax=Gaeumannomyces tritici (strain R3-111a-1) TaxID=644352 RepID=J3P2N5_GAET3|nr:hypothetical protein GGTG_07781 [Gaeumannomyces tritici R3-111a-1]EJT73927.1 hypothetical protein GGTG_07781 [Gaeumannomyces tritici R3-111a-1]